STIRSVFILDSAVAVLVSGKSLTIPILDVATSDLPAILEIVTALSAVAAVFTAVAFVNWAAYDAIVNQYAVRDSKNVLDPEFIQASDKHMEFTVKLLRSKFNIYGVDFFHPGRGALIYFQIV